MTKSERRTVPENLAVSLDEQQPIPRSRISIWKDLLILQLHSLAHDASVLTGSAALLWALIGYVHYLLHFVFGLQNLPDISWSHFGWFLCFSVCFFLLMAFLKGEATFAKDRLRRELPGLKLGCFLTLARELISLLFGLGVIGSTGYLLFLLLGWSSPVSTLNRLSLITIPGHMLACGLATYVDPRGRLGREVNDERRSTRTRPQIVKKSFEEGEQDKRADTDEQSSYGFEPKCPHCHSLINDDDHQVIICCAACKTFHHFECWTDHRDGKCALFGCGSSLYLVVTRPTEVFRFDREESRKVNREELRGRG